MISYDFEYLQCNKATKENSNGIPHTFIACFFPVETYGRETMMSLTTCMHIYSFEEKEQILWVEHSSIVSQWRA